MLLTFVALAGCADNSNPRVLTQPDISHVRLAIDDDANVQRFRRALVGLCVRESSLEAAIMPTATEPAYQKPGAHEIQIDRWLIDTEEMQFQLMTTNDNPIWVISGSFVEQDDAFIADANISELHDR